VNVFQGHNVTCTGNRIMAEMLSLASNWSFVGQWNVLVFFYICYCLLIFMQPTPWLHLFLSAHVILVVPCLYSCKM